MTCGIAVPLVIATAMPAAIVGHGYPYYLLIEEVARLGLTEWRELGGLSR